MQNVDVHPLEKFLRTAVIMPQTAHYQKRAAAATYSLLSFGAPDVFRFSPTMIETNAVQFIKQAKPIGNTTKYRLLGCLTMQ